MNMRAYLRGTDRQLNIGDALISDMGEVGELEAIDNDGFIKVNGAWRDPAWWGAQVREMSARELIHLMARHYATTRQCGGDVNTSALLIHAASLTLDLDDEQATEHVAEMIEEFYASQG